MKKLILLPLFAILSVVALSSSSTLNSAPNFGDDFVFPEYSKNLYIENTNLDDCDGCHASCGTTSCSGSGCCTCSCSTFNCTCTPNNGNNNKSQSAGSKISISISEFQYGNLKKIAHILYDSGDKNAYDAYIHLGNTVQTLKDKDAAEFDIQKNKYFDSLKNIVDTQTKKTLNEFFEALGVTDRV